jgi:hypothetical protein
MRSVRGLWLGAAAGVVFLTACGSDTVESTSTTSEQSGYCANVAALIDVLDDGGTIGDYNELLTAVADESPADHASTWSLLLTLSEEPFSYDNFNPAIDSLERLVPQLDVACPGLGEMIVDDAGRVRSFPTD